MNNDIQISDLAVSSDRIICEQCTGKNARSGHHDKTGWTNLVFGRLKKTLKNLSPD